MADRQDIDALIVGALYGEIDADERARLDAHLSSHPEDRAALEALERTRAQVRRGIADLPAAEPSAHISTMLLAAARDAHATAHDHEKRAVASEVSGPGLWSRFVDWMRPLVGHPAFAGAAVLVLVAGTATALWMRDKGQVSEPEVAARDRSSGAATSESAPPAAEPAREEMQAAQGSNSEVAALDQNEGAPAPSDVAVPAVAPGGYRIDSSADKGGKKAAPMKKKPSSDIGMLEVRTKGDEVTIKEEEDGKGGATAPHDGDDSLARDTVDGRRAEKTTTSGAGVQQQPAMEPKTIDPKLEEWAKGQHKKLAKLVADGKCPEAGRLGATIKDRAPEYYAASVANDRAIRACKSYIEGQAKKKADKNYKARSQNNAVDEQLDASQ